MILQNQSVFKIYRARKACYRPFRLFFYALLVLSLSSTLLLSFEQVVWANENATVLSSPCVHRLWGNDKRLPATLTVWQEVDLVYDRTFPYDRTRQPHPPTGCVVLPVISHHSVTKVLMLQCREYINLLRPAQWVSNRLYQQNRQEYLLLNIPEMGIQDVQMHIVAVRSSSFNPAILDVKSTSSRPVVGLFIRHTMNVRQYTFKDTITGKLDRVKATPNHPFYVINRHRYIPVSHLSTYDRLVNVLGHPVTLVCSPGKSSHCGQPYHPGQVITVYNLEVYGQHRYFIGEPGIMVHNVYHTCTYPGCGKRFLRPAELRRHERIHTDVRPFECKVCEKKFKQRIHLKKHLTTHTDDAPYACTDCNITFSRSDVWKRHFDSKRHKIKSTMTFEDALKDHNTSSGASGPSAGSEQVRARSRSPLGFNIPSSILPPEDDIDIPPLTPLVPNYSIQFKNIVEPATP